MDQNTLDRLAEEIRALRDDSTRIAGAQACTAVQNWRESATGRDGQRSADRVLKAIGRVATATGPLAERLSITYGLIATADATATPGHALADQVGDDADAIADVVGPLLQALVPVRLDDKVRESAAALILALTGVGRCLLGLSDGLAAQFVEAYGDEDGERAISRLAVLRSDLDRLDDLVLPPVVVTVSLPPRRAAVLEDLGGVETALALVVAAAADPELGPQLVELRQPRAGADAGPAAGANGRPPRAKEGVGAPLVP
ncbi:hypothetical protein ACFWXO_16440 [Kitasatospora sp. NPDC059088]|uniref:hypothetical protein n=1 Tax=Kitasatospora sp. NPDC059088 TaxID=3346722 RepID=UPI0036C6C328